MLLPRHLALLGPVAALTVVALGPALPQDEKRLSAREIFYSAPAETPAVPKAAPPKAAARKNAGETAKAKPSTPPRETPSPPPRAPEGGALVPASYSAASTYPLGIRYSILRREADQSVEVSPDAVFHSGDRIRLRVEANGNGYLYIIHRGSSGVWKPLFPSSDIAGGDNRVEKGKAYEIPSGYVFTFDEQPGEEKLFIVLSRQPEKDLEGLIYSLSGGEKPAQPPEGKLLLAQNLVNIDDELVGKLRKVYARDLIIEKVDETSAAPAAGAAKEKAVYVVNPARSADSRVVADVTLQHK